MPSAGINLAPTFFEPMNTPLWIRMGAGGTDYNLPGWRYITDTYTFTKDSTGFTNIKEFVSRQEFPAGPDTFGYMSPHTLLKPYQKSSVQPSINNIRTNSKNAVKYQVQGGFGYNPQLYVTSINRGAAITPGANWTAAKKPAGVTYDASQTYYYMQLVLNLPGNPSGPFVINSGLAINDIINVFYYDPSKLIYSQGKVRVVGISNSTFFYYNLITVEAIYSYTEWGNGGSNIPYSGLTTFTLNGEINDAVRMGAFTEELVTVNGTKQQNQLSKNWFQSSLNPSSIDYATTDYFTKWPYKDQWKKIYRNQLETVDFAFYPNSDVNSYKIKVYNKDKVELGTRYINFGTFPYTNLNNFNEFFHSVQVGYDKVMSQATPSAVNAFPTVKYYTVQIGFGGSGPGNVYSLPLKYEIVDEDCYHDNVRICWLNKKGGYDYFNFSHTSTRKVNIERTEWTRQQPVIATISDRAASVLSVSAQETYTASTEYLDPIEMDFLEDLYTSLDVYTVQTDGTLVPIVIINEPTYETYDAQSGKLAAVTINYKANVPMNLQGT